MAAGDIYRKTEQGQAEVKSRKLRLAPRVRTMLILIDGTQPEFMLKEEGQRVGAPPDFLQQLVSAGLIERVAGGVTPSPATAPAANADEFTRFREAKNFMNVTVVDALGIKSFFFTMKLEKASVRSDLADLADDYHKAIAKAEGEEAAAVLSARLKEMLR